MQDGSKGWVGRHPGRDHQQASEHYPAQHHKLWDPEVLESCRDQDPDEGADCQDATQNSKLGRPLAKLLSGHNRHKDLEVEPKCCGEEHRDHHKPDLTLSYHILHRFAELGAGVGFDRNEELILAHHRKGNYDNDIGEGVDDKREPGAKEHDQEARCSRANQSTSVEVS